MRFIGIFALVLISNVAFAAANMAKPAAIKSVTTSTKAAKSTPGQVSVRRENVTPPRLNRPRIVPTVGLANFDMVAVDDARTDQGLYIGVNGQLDRGPLGLTAGIGYLQAGAKMSDTGVRADILLDYIMFNAGAKMYFTPDRALYATGAIEPMINLHSTFDARGFGQRVKGKIHNVRDMDVLAKAGLGFEFLANPSSGMRMGGELSFHRGLMDARTGEGVFYNQGFLFSGFMSL